MEVSRAKQGTVDPILEKAHGFPTQQLNFIPTKVGKTSTLKVNLRNEFDHPITLEIASTSTNFKVSPEKVILKPHERIKLTVTFCPNKTGTWIGLITFKQTPNATDQYFMAVGKGI
jgi:hypothetical protein